MTTRMVLIIEYVGTRYYGFQLQTSLPTVQSEIEKALHKLTGESSRVMAASRTDTGVHARGQVVSFRTESPLPVERFVAGVNYYLPADIAVKAAYKVPVAFNVRREAISREYSYHILSSDTRSPLRVAFSYRVRGQLNIEAMNRACLALIGEHDFISFASALEKGKSTVRRVYQAKVEEHKDLVVFNIVANSFLPHQVRNTVGALIRVGLARMMVDEFCSIIDERKQGLAGPCVPACGLCLMQVNYARSFEDGI